MRRRRSTSIKLLTNVMLYWIGGINAANWIYVSIVEGTSAALKAGEHVKVPTGVLLFPNDLCLAGAGGLDSPQLQSRTAKHQRSRRAFSGHGERRDAHRRHARLLPRLIGERNAETLGNMTT